MGGPLWLSFCRTKSFGELVYGNRARGDRRRVSATPCRNWIGLWLDHRLSTESTRKTGVIFWKMTAGANEFAFG